MSVWLLFKDLQVFSCLFVSIGVWHLSASAVPRSDPVALGAHTVSSFAGICWSLSHRLWGFLQRETPSPRGLGGIRVRDPRQGTNSLIELRHQCNSAAQTTLGRAERSQTSLRGRGHKEISNSTSFCGWVGAQRARQRLIKLEKAALQNTIFQMIGHCTELVNAVM